MSNGNSIGNGGMGEATPNSSLNVFHSCGFVSSSKAGQHIVRDYREPHGHVVEMDNFFAWHNKDLFTFGQFALSRVLEPDSDAMPQVPSRLAYKSMCIS